MFFRKLVRFLNDGDPINPPINQEKLVFKDYEKSPLRFDLECLLEEYRSLRAEILVHLQNEQQILNFSIALMAATIALLQFEKELNVFLEFMAGSKSVLLLISFLFSALALMYLEQDFMMAAIGKYICTSLRPKIEAILLQIENNERNFFCWDDFKSQFLYGSSRLIPALLMSASRFALSIIPAFFILVYYINYRLKTSDQFFLWENLLFAFTSFAFLMAFFSTVINGLTYLNFVKRENNVVSINKESKFLVLLFRSKRFLVPFFTILIGYIPMVLLSIQLDAFWLSSRFDFPFLSIPSVVIGDLMILPVFNLLILNLLFDRVVSNLARRKIAMFYISSLVVSIALNIISNLSWVSDPYLGFMDIEYGRLSTAGLYHFFFSVFELSLVVFLFIILINSHKNKLKELFLRSYNLWKIVVAFTTLTIFDFLFRHLLVFRTNDLWIPFTREWASFATLYFSVAVLFFAKIRIRRF